MIWNKELLQDIAIGEVAELRQTELPCPSCQTEMLVEPIAVPPSLDYVPVKCKCGFMGRRVNLVVTRDEAGEGWKQVGSL